MPLSEGENGKGLPATKWVESGRFRGSRNNISHINDSDSQVAAGIRPRENRGIPRLAASVATPRRSRRELDFLPFLEERFRN